MGKDLERLKKKIAASRKALQQSEIKAEELDASIREAIRLQEKSRPRAD